MLCGGSPWLMGPKKLEVLKIGRNYSVLFRKLCGTSAIMGSRLNFLFIMAKNEKIIVFVLLCSVCLFVCVCSLFILCSVCFLFCAYPDHWTVCWLTNFFTFLTNGLQLVELSSTKSWFSSRSWHRVSLVVNLIMYVKMACTYMCDCCNNHPSMLIVIPFHYFCLLFREVNFSLTTWQTQWPCRAFVLAIFTL